MSSTSDTNDRNWRYAAGQSFNDQGESIVTVLSEIYLNLVAVLDMNYDDDSPVMLERAAGGLDAAAEKISALLQLPHMRRYHDDGCEIDYETLDDPDGDGGHDGEEGCEYAGE